MRGQIGQRLLDQIPAIRKRERHRRAENRLADGQNHVDEAAQRARAVNLRRLDHVARQADHVLPQQKDVERRNRHRQDDRPDRIQQPHRAQGDDVWHHRDLKRQEHQHDDDEEQRVPPAEPEAGERVGHRRNQQRLPEENRRGIHRRIDEVAQNRHVLNQYFIILAEGKHVGRELDFHQALRVEAAARLHERLDFAGRKEGIQRRQHHRQQDDDRRRRQQQPRQNVPAPDMRRANRLFFHPPHLNSARARLAFAGRTARRTARTRSGRRNRPPPSPAGNSACRTYCSCSFAGCIPSNPGMRPR